MASMEHTIDLNVSLRPGWCVETAVIDTLRYPITLVGLRDSRRFDFDAHRGGFSGDGFPVMDAASLRVIADKINGEYVREYHPRIEQGLPLA